MDEPLALPEEGSEGRRDLVGDEERDLPEQGANRFTIMPGNRVRESYFEAGGYLHVHTVVDGSVFRHWCVRFHHAFEDPQVPLNASQVFLGHLDALEGSGTKMEQPVLVDAVEV